MNTKVTLLGLLGLCFSSPLYAEDMPPPPHHRGEARFEKADANKDGKLSLEEFLVHPTKKFTDLDSNKDKHVTLEELKAGREKWHKKHPRPMEAK